MGPPSAEFWGGVTFLSILAVVGGVAKWVWAQWKGGMDARTAKIEQREAAFEAKRDQRVGQLEADVAALSGKLDNMADVQNRQRRAIDLLVMEVARLDPGSKLLVFVRQLLGEDMPLNAFTMPHDLVRLASEIDGGDDDSNPG